MSVLIARLSGLVLPAWVKWVALAVLVVAAYGAGRVHEARRAVDVLSGYIGKQAAQTVRIIERQAKTDVLVQTKYVDRIQKIYVQGPQLKRIFQPTFSLLIMSASVLMLASCASSTPPGQVRLSDPPPILTANPPAFRSMTSRSPRSATPPAAAPGGSKPLAGVITMPASR